MSFGISSPSKGKIYGEKFENFGEFEIYKRSGWLTIYFEGYKLGKFYLMIFQRRDIKLTRIG